MAPRWQDHFTREAKAAGYPARSVFKLDEVQRRMRVVNRGMRVVDLGCYPGSWSIFLADQGVARIVGVDLMAPQRYPGVFLEADVNDLSIPALLEALGGPADLLVSDMAPSTTGQRFTDHVRQMALAHRALDVARAVLRPGGNFVAKAFEGADTAGFVDEVRRSFEEMRRIKPAATRKASVELFVAAKGFRAQPI